MAILDFHATRNEINQILLSEIRMPNFKSILNDHIRVFVHSVDNSNYEKINSDPDEPMNIRFRMDQTDVKIPIYIKENCEIPVINLARSFQFSDNKGKNNPIGIVAEFSIENDYILSGRFEFTFMKKYPGNWNSMFTYNEQEINNKFLVPNSNSIIINDNYLFNNIGQSKKNLGIINIENLLFAIMPEDCSIEFQISIFTSQAKWDLLAAKKHFEELFSSLKNKFNYPIFLELIIWDSVENHKRMLISNYFIATTDKGFDLFDESNRATDINDVLIRRIFHDIRQPGESPYMQSLKRLSLLRKTYIDARNYCSRAVQMKGKIYLSSDPNKNVKNRLLFE
jgi:hypothetical protein